ncbi:hypothetical protein AAE478_001948 [Parahypoxylon ruwenzoriense]
MDALSMWRAIKSLFTAILEIAVYACILRIAYVIVYSGLLTETVESIRKDPRVAQETTTSTKVLQRINDMRMVKLPESSFAHIIQKKDTQSLESASSILAPAVALLVFGMMLRANLRHTESWSRRFFAGVWRVVGYAYVLSVAYTTIFSRLLLDKTEHQRRILGAVVGVIARLLTAVVREVATLVCESRGGLEVAGDNPSYTILVYRRCVAFLRGLGTIRRRSLLILNREARRTAAIALEVAGFLVYVLSWVLWVYAISARTLEDELVLEPTPLSWEEVAAVRRYFDEVELKSKPRWRHMADGEVVRVGDWRID